ncbi:MAG: hypothetical protein WAT66_13340 [Actinomycetota bacterium]
MTTRRTKPLDELVHVENLFDALTGENVSLGDGLWMPTSFVVHFRDPRRRFEARLHARVGKDLRPRCTRVELSALGRNVITDMRSVPLPVAAILREAARQATQESTRKEAPGRLLSKVRGGISFAPTFSHGPGAAAVESRLRRRGYQALTDEHLAKVAAIYRSALREKQPPIRAVERELQTSYATARRWVYEARKPTRGFLGPTTERRAGELKPAKSRRKR